MLTAVWQMLRQGAEWHEPGSVFLDRADAAKTANLLIRRLQHIGCHVAAEPV